MLNCMLRKLDVISKIMISQGRVLSEEYRFLKKSPGHGTGHQVEGGPTGGRESS